MGCSIRFPPGVATVLAVLLVVAPHGVGAMDAYAAVPMGLRVAWFGTGGFEHFPGHRQDPQARDSARRDAPELTPAMVEAEMERRLNDLRTDLLANQAATVNWWLRMMAVILTFFGIGVPLLGFLGFNRFREIERDVKQSAAAVAQVAESAQRYAAGRELDAERRVEPGVLLDARSVAAQPEDAAEMARKVGEDPGASLVELAWLDAWRHQVTGEQHEAREKWRAIERIAEERDAHLASTARASVAFLSRKAINDGFQSYITRGTARLEAGQNEEAIAEYDEALRRDPSDAVAYAMRGFAKGELGKHEEAIADFDEAIRLNPDDAFSFLSRGRANWETGRQDQAMEDFDVAIALEPQEAGGFLARGVLKRERGLHEEARRDIESALCLAQSAGDGQLADKAEGFLRSWQS